MDQTSSLLVELCERLRSGGPISQRRQAWDNLLELIQSSDSCVQQLDASTAVENTGGYSSARRDGGAPTWNHIADGLLAFLHAEFDGYVRRAAKAAQQSAPGAMKRVAVPAAVVGALRSFVRRADQRGPVLFRSVRKIFGHLASTESHPVMKPLLGREYCELFRALLDVPAYCHCLTAKLWTTSFDNQLAALAARSPATATATSSSAPRITATTVTAAKDDVGHQRARLLLQLVAGRFPFSVGALLTDSRLAELESCLAGSDSAALSAYGTALRRLLLTDVRAVRCSLDRMFDGLLAMLADADPLREVGHDVVDLLHTHVNAYRWPCVDHLLPPDDACQFQPHRLVRQLFKFVAAVPPVTNTKPGSLRLYAQHDIWLSNSLEPARRCLLQLTVDSLCAILAADTTLPSDQSTAKRSTHPDQPQSTLTKRRLIQSSTINQSIHQPSSSSTINQSIHQSSSSSTINQSIHQSSSSSTINQSIHQSSSSSTISQSIHQSTINQSNQSGLNQHNSFMDWLQIMVTNLDCRGAWHTSLAWLQLACLLLRSFDFARLCSDELKATCCHSLLQAVVRLLQLSSVGVELELWCFDVVMAAAECDVVGNAQLWEELWELLARRLSPLAQHPVVAARAITALRQVVQHRRLSVDVLGQKGSALLAGLVARHSVRSGPTPAAVGFLLAYLDACPLVERPGGVHAGAESDEAATSVSLRHALVDWLFHRPPSEQQQQQQFVDGCEQVPLLAADNAAVATPRRRHCLAVLAVLYDLPPSTLGAQIDDALAACLARGGSGKWRAAAAAAAASVDGVQPCCRARRDVDEFVRLWSRQPVEETVTSHGGSSLQAVRPTASTTAPTRAQANIASDVLVQLKARCVESAALRINESCQQLRETRADGSLTLGANIKRLSIQLIQACDDVELGVFLLLVDRWSAAGGSGGGMAQLQQAVAAVVELMAGELVPVMWDGPQSDDESVARWLAAVRQCCESGWLWSELFDALLAPDALAQPAAASHWQPLLASLAATMIESTCTSTSSSSSGSVEADVDPFDLTASTGGGARRASLLDRRAMFDQLLALFASPAAPSCCESATLATALRRWSRRLAAARGCAQLRYRLCLAVARLLPTALLGELLSLVEATLDDAEQAGSPFVCAALLDLAGAMPPPPCTDDAALARLARLLAYFDRQLARGLDASTRLSFARCLHQTVLHGRLEQQFSQAADIFLRLLADADLRVARYTTSAVKSFFVVWTQHGPLFASVCEELVRDGEEAAVRAVLVQAEICTVSEANEPAIVYALCERAARATPTLRRVVGYALARVATALRYASARALLDDHVGDVLRRWLSARPALGGNALAGFPAFLWGHRTLPPFCAAYAHAVVPLLVLFERQDSIEYVARAADTTPAQLVEAQFGRVFAAVFPLLYGRDKRRGHQVCGDFFGRHYYAKEQLQLAIPRHLDSVLVALFDSIDFDNDDDHETPPLYAPRTVLAVLHNLSSSYGVALDALLTKSRRRVHALLLHLRRRFCSTHRAGGRLQALRALRFLVRAVGEVLPAHDALLRQLVHCLVHCAHESSGEPAVHAAACRAIEDVVQQVHGVEPQALAPYVGVLFEADVDQPVESLLQQHYFAELQALDGASLADTVPQLVRRFRTGDAASLERDLEQLRGHMHGQRLDDAAVVQLVWALTELVAVQALSSCARELVAGILAELAPFFNPTVVCFADRHAVVVASSAVAALPQQLAGFVVDADVALSEAASQCAEHMFATEQGRELLSSDELHRLLAPFVDAGKSRRRAAPLPPPASRRDTVAQLRWLPAAGASYAAWLCDTSAAVAAALRSPVLRLCAPLCRLRAQFAAQLFPELFCALVTDDDDDDDDDSEAVATAVGQALRQAFEQVLCHGGAACTHREQAVRLLLAALNLLRQRSTDGRRRTSSSWSGSAPWRQLDLLGVAQAAERCSAYLSALVYAELWCEQQCSGELALPEAAAAREAVTGTLFRVFSAINEPDAIHGIGRLSSLHSAQQELELSIRLYEHQQQWDRAASAYDTALALRPHNAELQRGLFNALLHQGQLSLVEQLTAGRAALRSDALDDICYEVAWRSGNWSVETALPTDSAQPFHAVVYASLRALREGNSRLFFPALQRGRELAVRDLGRSSSESTKRVAPLLVRLAVLEDVLQAWPLRWPQQQQQQQVHSGLITALAPETKRVPGDVELRPLQQRWEARLATAARHRAFSCIELPWAVHSALLRIVERPDAVADAALSFARVARKCDKFHIASTALRTLDDSGPQRHARLLELAKLLWRQGDRDRAVQTLHGMIDSERDDSDAAMRAAVLRTAGKWLGASRAAEGVRVQRDYLEPAVAAQATCQTHFTLAAFLDRLYATLAETLASPEYTSGERLREYSEAMLQRVEDELSREPDAAELKVLRAKLQRQMIVQHDDHQRMTNNRDLYLFGALTNYLSCLALGDAYDIRAVFRLCALWFDTPEQNERVHGIMTSERLGTVPTRKFLPLVYQLASLLSYEQRDKPFQRALVSVLLRLAVDFPNLSLWQIKALSNANRTAALSLGVERSSRAAQQRRRDTAAKRGSTSIDEDKVAAARMFLELPALAVHQRLLAEMDALIDGYFELALLDAQSLLVGASRRSVHDLLPVPLKELRDCACLAVPTQRRADVLVQRFDRRGFRLVGGINVPKLITCLGSDGVAYQQLVKGKDDLRQDAVMQQIFGLVDALLRQEDVQARTRQLGIRQYRVVPLSPMAGVIEWVENTVSLGDYLQATPSTVKHSAHVRFRPRDWKPYHCRELLKNAAETALSDTYAQICAHFKPVFHHFFLERFPDPADWFQKRTNYTRSAAAASIVGYIVGLGDRHSQNILVDMHTADLIHIDLGVAFEQGRILNTPETVPFRLTRDIVDGMGVAGLEGSFRRCCEITLSVMRHNRDALLTVLQVFLHDPLFHIQLSPERALRIEKTYGRSHVPAPAPAADPLHFSRSDASRILMRVKAKLQGVEYGEPLSTEGQVNQLINEARDPERLARMFHGWAPYL